MRTRSQTDTDMSLDGAGMVKIADLRIEQLKSVLNQKGLPTSGTRAELIQRLSDNTDSDEIQLPSVQTSSANANVQVQINELRDAIDSILSVLQQTVPNANNNNVENHRETTTPPTSDVSAPESGGRSQTVREISETIPEFDPTNPQSLTVEQFTDRVSSVVRAYQFDEKCLLLAVYSRLRGAARMWLDSLPRVHYVERIFERPCGRIWCPPRRSTNPSRDER